MSMSVLAGTLTATVLTTAYSDWLMNVLDFEKVVLNTYRQMVMLICCLIYFSLSIIEFLLQVEETWSTEVDSLIGERTFYEIFESVSH